MSASDTGGIIEGGWAYVWASYLLFWVFVGGYAVSLFVRSREER